jgi:CheY-like chemotaxis protein
MAERVVLVVDEAVVRQYTSRALREEGFRTLEAGDGAEAKTLLEALGATVIGLVVSDQAMPRVTGEGLAAEMAARWPTVLILLVSGQGGPQIGYQGAFLRKPYTPEALIAALAGLLPSIEACCGSRRQ